MALIKCTKCGNAISDKVKICPQCGEVKKAMIKCKECGEPVESGVDACPKCGYPIKENKNKIRTIFCIASIVVILFFAIIFIFIGGGCVKEIKK